MTATPGGKRSIGLWLITSMWLLAIGAGMGLLLSYQFTPGRSAEAPGQWPARTTLKLHKGVPTIIMVAHPKCSCTRASIGELARLMTRLRGLVRGYVLFMIPRGVGESWANTDLWQSAALIPDIELVRDENGTETDLFGARTSGQTYLFSEGGKLLFSGGITPSRSHYGNSVGREQLISLVTGKKHERSGSAVYGCSLHDEGKGGDR